MKELETDLLAALLGQLEALFEPINYAWEGKLTQYQAVWQRRHKWQGLPGWPEPGLLPWTNPGTDQAAKKRCYRAMLALERQGLIRLNIKAAGLTAEGLTAARKLCGHVQLDDCLPGLDIILGFIGTAHEWTGGEGSHEGGYVSEASMSGYEPWPPGKIGKPRLPASAAWVIDALLPLAIAGLIDHDYRPGFELPLYYLIPAGKKLAEERRRTGKANPGGWGVKLKNKIRHNEPAAYWQALEAERARLEASKPLQPCRVKHPPGDLWPRNNEGRGIKN